MVDHAPVILLFVCLLLMAYAIYSDSHGNGYAYAAPDGNHMQTALAESLSTRTDMITGGDRKVTRFPDDIIAFSRNTRECVDYAQFEIVGESMYSSLLPYQVPQVSKILRALDLTPKLIIDATAHIGCDSVNFARVFPDAAIMAIEYDDAAYECLRNNLRTIVGSNARAVHVDAARWLTAEEFKADIVYFDPPWGGPAYLSAGKLDMPLSGVRVAELICQLFDKDRAAVVILKAPTNYDLAGARQICAKVAKVRGIYPVLKPYRSKKGAVSYILIVFDRKA